MRITPWLVRHGCTAMVLLAICPTARAEQMIDSRGFTRAVFPTDLSLINALLSTAAGSTAVTTLLENGLAARAGSRAPRIWRALGYVMGAASTGLGVVNLVGSAGNAGMIGAGAALVAVGLIDLGVVHWSSKLAESAHPRALSVIFGPRVLTDSTGRPAYGVGFSLANW